jgi:hypothetical protein
MNTRRDRFALTVVTPQIWTAAGAEALAGKNEQGPTATLAFLAFLAFENL